MLIPLVGFTEDGTPSLSVAARGEAADVPPLQVVRRLGIAAAQILWLPPALLDGAPGDAVKDALLRAVACVAGPFAPAQTEGARAWLNAGARGALFTAEVGCLADAAESLKAVALPAERVQLLVRPAELTTEAVKALVAELEAVASATGGGCHECRKPDTVGKVNGVVIALPAAGPADDATARAQAEDLLLQLASPLAKKDRLQVAVSGLRHRHSSAAVGDLHRLGIDVVACASLGPLPAATAAAAAAAAAAAGDATAAANKAATEAAAKEERVAAALPPCCEPIHLGRSLEVGRCVAACLRTDRPDKLYPTVVVESSGAPLGLVYSSDESICAALRCGRGVYWSRSRGGLWRKGDTSGDWQHLIRVTVSDPGFAPPTPNPHNSAPLSPRPRPRPRGVFRWIATTTRCASWCSSTATLPPSATRSPSRAGARRRGSATSRAR